jgi:DNA-binding transcriptional ArsR family regulator
MTQPKPLYTIVSEDDVYHQLVHLAVDIFNPIGGLINITNLARLLNTSKYQVRKHMHSLRDKGWVELKCVKIPDDEELYPPYWGYVLTLRGRDTKYYAAAYEKENRIINECFGSLRGSNSYAEVIS